MILPECQDIRILNQFFGATYSQNIDRGGLSQILPLVHFELCGYGGGTDKHAEVISSSPVLCSPDFTKPFIFQTDAFDCMWCLSCIE